MWLLVCSWHQRVFMKKHFFFIGFIIILLTIYFFVFWQKNDGDTNTINQDRQSHPIINNTAISEVESNAINLSPNKPSGINSVIEAKEQTLNFARSVLNINNIDHQAELYAFNFIDNKMVKVIVQFSDGKVSSVISGQDQQGGFVIDNGRVVLDKSWSNYPPLTYDEAFAKIISNNSEIQYGESNLYYLNTSSAFYYKFPSSTMDYYVNVEDGEVISYIDAMKDFKESDVFIKLLYLMNADGTISINEEFSKKHLNHNEIEDVQLSISDINRKILAGEVSLDENFQFKNKSSIEIVPIKPSLTNPTIIPLPNSEIQYTP